ncbi:SLAC1 anion channel family protein [Paraflavitalea sp. CAU 1676]|uniref:SLAC1 anion channel family protein n=1 Tax=Paraflavitalea sp. CAU 1676 TaxID=3032598 RepID=UPI0023DB2D3F|nr:SLAC1 anion channel family protein [Paraflavitalea sp. CAU 1676]MDF2190093.1 SLAC1 anion channel family protein [Paraflavitalea sp. CAU 1676]
MNKISEPRSSQLDRFLETGLTAFNKSISKRSAHVRSLRYLPVNLFGAVMGIAGLSLALRQASAIYGFSSSWAQYTSLLALLVFITLAIAYITKVIFFAGTVREEFHHAIVGNFFGTIPVSILLLSAVIRPDHPQAGQYLWISGVFMTLALSYIMVKRLINNRQDLLHATPAWLIPGVGTLDVVVTGKSLPYSWSTEVNLLAFAIGSMLALVFFTLIFSRLMHHDPMPQRLTPSLIILIAPFEVGFLAYINVTGRIDLFASTLFYFGLFLFTILFFKVFTRKLPFMITWWAVGFPLAALSNAALKYATYVNSRPLYLLAGLILFILIVTILLILARTLVLLARGQLLQENK